MQEKDAEFKPLIPLSLVFESVFLLKIGIKDFPKLKLYKKPLNTLKS